MACIRRADSSAQVECTCDEPSRPNPNEPATLAQLEELAREMVTFQEATLLVTTNQKALIEAQATELQWLRTRVDVLMVELEQVRRMAMRPVLN